MEAARLTAIEKNAELVIATLGKESGIAFGLDRDSVAWLEGFIERQRDGADAAGLSPVLACFLGEAIRAAAGGEWADDSALGLGLRFANGDWCFPFAKVAKQLENGADAGDGVLGFYDGAMAVARR